MQVGTISWNQLHVIIILTYSPCFVTTVSSSNIANSSNCRGNSGKGFQKFRKVPTQKKCASMVECLASQGLLSPWYQMDVTSAPPRFPPIQFLFERHKSQSYWLPPNTWFGPIWFSIKMQHCFLKSIVKWAWNSDESIPRVFKGAVLTRFIGVFWEFLSFVVFFPNGHWQFKWANAIAD